jgi:uncharacterized membrane protein YqiK
VKFVLFGEHKKLPEGRIIATKGEAGYQAQTLAPGIYFWFWFWQYDILLQPLTVIPNGKIGLLLARDGKELPTGQILARRVDCDSYQDAEKFLNNGGSKGRQAAVLQAGSYRINTFLFEILVTDITTIQDNMVGIVTTMDGVQIRTGPDSRQGHNRT